MTAFLFFLIGVLLLCLAHFACFVALVVEMFKNDDTGWGIACIVLGGCGQLIALFYGWSKVGEWDISLLMLAYSLCSVGLIIQFVMFIAKFAGTLPA